MPPDTLTLEVISPNVIEVWGGVDIGPPGPAGTTDHLLLLNVGTTTHDDIDTHIADTNNPHATTADQVLPSQTGNNGKYLTTDGTTASWGTVSGGGGGGVTDHGALTGLSDDDHNQYHTDARGDARYSALGHNHSGVYDPAGTASAAVTAHESALDPHPTYLTSTEGNSAYAALGHAHSGVYDPAGTASAAVSAHEGAVDPHPTYLTATEGNAAYSALGHNHDVTYAPLAKGVTNGDSHDHSGGDGGQISYSTLSNIPSSFTPAAHATSHKSGGSDAIKLDELAAPTDVTTLNASDSAHGLLPKLANTGTKYLRDDGTWQTVSSGSSTQAFGTISVSGQSDVVADAAPDTLTLVASTNVQITTDASSDTITIAASHNHDATYAPLAKGVTNGDSHDHSGGDGAQISYANLSNIPSSFTPAAHATSHKSAGSDAIKLDELAAPTDVTTLNASAGAHGLLPKLDNTSTKYLRDDGTWQTVSASPDSHTIFLQALQLGAML